MKENENAWSYVYLPVEDIPGWDYAHMTGDRIERLPHVGCVREEKVSDTRIIRVMHDHRHNTCHVFYYEKIEAEAPEQRLRYPVGSTVRYKCQDWKVKLAHLSHETINPGEEARGNPYNSYRLSQEDYAGWKRDDKILFEYHLYDENREFPRQPGEDIYLLSDEVPECLVREFMRSKNYNNPDTFILLSHAIYWGLHDYQNTKDLYNLGVHYFGIPWKRVREIQQECVARDLKRGPNSYVKQILKGEKGR